ncbi:hypothetical protein [Desulfosporosinus sp.]|nr:hypothetical protein [Desulfosporosinus sp.]MDA8222585.1 hypothetical protein [Desulfitobacterium hafniense]
MELLWSCGDPFPPGKIAELENKLKNVEILRHDGCTIQYSPR